MSNEPDQALLLRFVHGDRGAFEALFRAFEHDVHRWILRIVRDASTAEDEVIEAFWRCYWLVCRSGGPASALTLAAFVGVREVPALYAAVMALLDHFGGAWLITHHGMNARPSSWLWTVACIVAGAICGARPSNGAAAPSTAAR